MTRLQPQPLSTSQPATGDPVPRVSLFTLPKAFTGHTGLIQRNALASWKQLGSDVQVLVAGDDPGVEQTTRELELEYLGPVRRNEHGTPFLDDVFARARSRARANYLMYVNTDIVLFSDLLQTLDHLEKLPESSWLVTGRRLELDVDEPLAVSEPDWATPFRHQARRAGRWASAVCKDYFLFPRTCFETLPPFLVGRGNWDNWMIHEARRLRIPVIDATASMLVVHQNHDYGHVRQSRFSVYVSGAEARHNARVGDGAHLWTSSYATWELDPAGQLARCRWHRYLQDVPRFAGLLGTFCPWPRRSQRR